MNKKIAGMLTEVVYKWVPDYREIEGFRIMCRAVNIPKSLLNGERVIDLEEFLCLAEHFGIGYCCGENIYSSRSVDMLRTLAKHGAWVGLIGNSDQYGGNIHIIIADDEDSARCVYNTNILDDEKHTIILGRFYEEGGRFNK